MCSLSLFFQPFPNFQINLYDAKMFMLHSAQIYSQTNQFASTFESVLITFPELHIELTFSSDNRDNIHSTAKMDSKKSPQIRTTPLEKRKVIAEIKDFSRNLPDPDHQFRFFLSTDSINDTYCEIDRKYSSSKTKVE